MHILVVDDHHLFIDGMAYLLHQLAADVSIDVATDVRSALELVGDDKGYDLVLLDLHMPGMNGLAFLQSLRQTDVALPIVVVSGDNEPSQVKQALDMGALGYVPKHYNAQTMLSALQSVIEGEIFLPPEAAREVKRLQAQAADPGPLGDEPPAQNATLTRRQQQVLQLLAIGHSNRDIASMLFVTENTVKAHVKALFSVLKAHNRTECVAAARRRGWLVNN